MCTAIDLVLIAFIYVLIDVFQMHLARKGINALRSKHGTTYQAGSPANILCKFCQAVETFNCLIHLFLCFNNVLGTGIIFLAK